MLWDAIWARHVELRLGSILFPSHERLKETVQLATIAKAHDQIVVRAGVDDDAARQPARHPPEFTALAVRVDGRLESLRLMHVTLIAAAHV